MFRVRQTLNWWSRAESNRRPLECHSSGDERSAHQSFFRARPNRWICRAIEPGILLALGAGLFFALYLIATRQASKASDPVKTLAFQCVVGTILLTPQALLTWSAPGWDAVLFFVGLGALSAMSHFMSIAAFRFADASTLSPLVYLELIGATVIGYLAFGDIPQGSTIAGAALIVAAGLLLLKCRTESDTIVPKEKRSLMPGR